MKNINRTSYTQLPEVKELVRIMEKEAKREVAKGKEETHYPVFEAVENWLRCIGINTMTFRSEDVWQKTLFELNSLVPEVVIKTLNYEGDLKMFDKVSNYLGEEDNPQKSDLIFVFGSKSLARIEKATELYRKKTCFKNFYNRRSSIL